MSHMRVDTELYCFNRADVDDLACGVDALVSSPRSIRCVHDEHGWRSLRGKSDSIVVANGCFDLPHLGHLSLLRAAKSLGPRLIVAVDADARVRALKGPHRPILPLRVRLVLLDSWKLADAFVVFSEDEHLGQLMQALRPVLVKGAGSPDTPGQQFARVFAQVQLVPSYSTTGLIDAVAHCAPRSLADAVKETQ